MSRLSAGRPPVAVLIPAATNSSCLEDEEASEDASSVSSSGASSAIRASPESASSHGLDSTLGSPTTSATGDGAEGGVQQLLRAFQVILDESRKSTSRSTDVQTKQQKREWWERRLGLDVRLGALMRSMEDTWLGPWKVLLFGEPDDRAVLEASTQAAAELAALITSSALLSTTDLELLRLLLLGAEALSERHLADALGALFREAGATVRLSSDAQVAAVLRAAGELSRGLPGGTANGACTSSPVELILDSKLQALPWENLPCISNQLIYRMPSFGSLHALVEHRRFLTAPEMPKPQPSTAKTASKTRKAAAKRGEVGGKRSGRSQQVGAHPGGPQGDSCAEMQPVNAARTFYLLNPSGDLRATQLAFEAWFQSQASWQGIIGRVPSTEEYGGALQSHDLFVYCGHGSGGQYLRPKHLRRLPRCAAALIMGCSSGRLSPRGMYEPSGVPLAYLMAGCPTAVANLWDVTDGDIDRFSSSVLRQWLTEGGDEESGRPEREGCSGVLSSSQDSGPSNHGHTGQREGGVPTQGCEAQPSQRGRQRRSPAVLPEETERARVVTADDVAGEVRSCLKGELRAPGRSMSYMGQAVVQGRKACRLRHLIGASPICYGIPTPIVMDVRSSHMQ